MEGVIKKLKDIMSKVKDEAMAKDSGEKVEVTDKKTTKKKSSKKDDKLNLKIEELEQELAEAKDKYLRLFAEFDNFKKRNIKERMDILKSAAQDTISVLLPVLDDFDRAKAAAEDENSVETISEGVLMVYNKIYAVLGNKGLKPMESTGEAFDPELHEGITEIPAPTEEMKGKNIDTVEKGYYLNDKIIRHAKVVIGK